MALPQEKGLVCQYYHSMVSIVLSHKAALFDGALFHYFGLDNFRIQFNKEHPRQK